jgi:hypothetical protein
VEEMRAKGLVFKFEVEVGLKSFALSRPERNLNHRPRIRSLDMPPRLEITGLPLKRGQGQEKMYGNYLGA